MTAKKKPGRGKRRASAGKSTSPETIACREKQARALELRKEGMQFEDIAKEVGYKNRQRAHEAVTEAIRRITREAAEDVRDLELARLDSMWEIHYLNAKAGDVNALSACMRMMDRRAKLLGIDAPTKIDATVETPGGVLVAPAIVDPAQWAAAAKAHQEQLAANEAAADVPQS